MGEDIGRPGTAYVPSAIGVLRSIVGQKKTGAKSPGASLLVPRVYDPSALSV